MATSTIAQSPPHRVAWIPIIWIGALHVGALLAFVPGYFSWSGLALCVLLHWLTGGIGICMTYHRLLTHRSFALRPRWLEYFFTIIGTLASEGGAIGWVADHRRHHANSDEENDTHTPNEGFLWAHMYWWMFFEESTVHSEKYYQKWAPDLNRDPVHRFIERLSHHLPDLALRGAVCTGRDELAGLGRFPAVGPGPAFDLAGELGDPPLGLSLAHDAGQLDEPVVGRALTYGEGWHNNHHAFQTSARHGLRWWEVDMTYIAIWTMKTCRIAYNIKLVKVPSRRLTRGGRDRRGGDGVIRLANRGRQRPSA